MNSFSNPNSVIPESFHSPDEIIIGESGELVRDLSQEFPQGTYGDPGHVKAWQKYFESRRLYGLEEAFLEALETVAPEELEKYNLSVSDIGYIALKSKLMNRRDRLSESEFDAGQYSIALEELFALDQDTDDHVINGSTDFRRDWMVQYAKNRGLSADELDIDFRTQRFIKSRIFKR